MERLKITEEVITNQNIDTRIMTCIGMMDESAITFTDCKEASECDYVLYTYDYNKLTEDDDINKAIIFHEM